MIIFYSGSDTYRLRLGLTQALEKLTAQHGPLRLIDDLEMALKYPAFLGEHTCVVVKNPFADAESAERIHDLCARYQAATLPDTTLVLCQEDGGGRDSAAVRTLKAFLGTHAHESVVFEPLIGTERVRWMQAYSTVRGGMLPAPTASTLVQRVGNDSWKLATELDKLCAYAGDEEISPNMVRLLSAERHEADDFQLSNALAAKDKRGALSALWSRLQAGTAEQLLLGLMAYSMRTLLTRGNSAYQTDQLVRAHVALATLDRNAKDGQADMTDGLFAVLLHL